MIVLWLFYFDVVDARRPPLLDEYETDSDADLSYNKDEVKMPVLADLDDNTTCVLCKEGTWSEWGMKILKIKNNEQPNVFSLCSLQNESVGYLIMRNYGLSVLFSLLWEIQKGSIHKRT